MNVIKQLNHLGLYTLYHTHKDRLMNENKYMFEDESMLATLKCWGDVVMPHPELISKGCSRSNSLLDAGSSTESKKH